MFFGYVHNMPETKTDSKITIRSKLINGEKLEDHEKKSSIRKSSYTVLRQRYNNVYDSRFERNDEVDELLRIKGAI